MSDPRAAIQRALRAFLEADRERIESLLPQRPVATRKGKRP